MRSRFIEMFGNPIVNEKKWKVVLLDDACEGIGDGLHGTPKYDDLGDYPFINGNNLIDGVIKITTSTRMVNEETYKKHYTNINNNAILISINGTLGKLAFYNGEKLMLGKSACYCNLKSNINRDFVYSVMKTEAFAGYLDSNSTSSTIKNIGLKAMRAFRLIQPPSKMQIEYVDFAKQIDKSKFLLQQMIEKLELLKKSRFIEMFEKEKYPVVNLEELIDKNIETAKKDFSKESIIKYIDISSIDNVNHRIIGYNEFVLSDAPSRAQQHIRFNDILVSTVRPNLKNVARVELKDSNLVASSGFCVLRPKKCSSEYLLSIVKSDKFTLDMSQAVSGATYPAIKDSDIYNYKIKYPPKEIQNAFSLFVKQLDKSKFWTKILG